jgi:hypothetical protein
MLQNGEAFFLMNQLWLAKLDLVAPSPVLLELFLFEDWPVCQQVKAHM